MTESSSDGFITRAVRRASRTSIARDLWFRRWGSLREKERFGLIDRPQYAYGVLRAADVARYFGLDDTSGAPFTADRRPAFTPMLTFGYGGFWIHGYPYVPGTRSARAPRAPTTAASAVSAFAAH